LEEKNMTQKIVPHNFFPILVLFVTLACDSPFLRPVVEPTPRTFTFQGTGIHTWAWNNGEQTCDTKDDMTLIIDAGNVTLRSEGKRTFIQGLNPFTCYELHPGECCGITLIGNYREPNLIEFNSCSNNEPITGTAKEQNGDVSGSAQCGAEMFTISLPEVK
jgi:hypothetical protein